MKNKKIDKDLIYLASPYTHTSKKTMHYRFERVLELTAKLISEGHFVFSPIAYGHVMAKKHKMPTDWEYWLEFDRLFISRCDKLLVFKLDGWDKSKGVNAEIKIANEFNIPIDYVEQ